MGNDNKILGKVVQITEGADQRPFRNLARDTVEDMVNKMLDAEADVSHLTLRTQPCSHRYSLGYYKRSFHTKAKEVNLKTPNCAAKCLGVVVEKQKLQKQLSA